MIYLEHCIIVQNTLESHMSEWFDNAIEINALEVSGDGYRAHIGYDGVNNEGFNGTCTFKCHMMGAGQISDFEITNVTGSGFRPFSDRLKSVLGQ